VTNPPTPSTWIDDFLFADLLLVALILLVDFLLGKELRGVIRDNVGWWGLRLA